MKEIGDVTALVFDHGLGLPIAERLARDCKRVLYHSPWEEGFSTISKGILGDGIPGIERCDDYWSVKDEVDLWVFPDIQHGGLQTELRSQGCAVWGSGYASNLETNRELFLKVLEQVGLDVPKFKVCVGITALRRELKERENVYIKISKYRGSLETKHFRSWGLDANLLDLWAVRFGGVRELVRFLVFDAIETPLEIGGDTYCVGGQWPSPMLHGIEAKDKSYFSAVTRRDEMPDQIQAVNEAFGPILAGYNYANEWSVEIRVLGDKFYFIDPTCRMGLPSTSSQLELWSNWSEILWAGAHGELLDPEPLGKFSAEIILNAKADEGLWPSVEIPKELTQWVKLHDCCEVDGLRVFPRQAGDSENCGWLVAIGDSPQETLDNLKEYVAMLPDGLSGDLSPIADVIKEIEIEQAKGIEFSDETMPEPAEVLESV